MHYLLLWYKEAAAHSFNILLPQIRRRHHSIESITTAQMLRPLLLESYRGVKVMMKNHEVLVRSDTEIYKKIMN